MLRAAASLQVLINWSDGVRSDDPRSNLTLVRSGCTPCKPTAGRLKETVAVGVDVGVKGGRKWRVGRRDGHLGALLLLGLLPLHLQKLPPLAHLPEDRPPQTPKTRS